MMRSFGLALTATMFITAPVAAQQPPPLPRVFVNVNFGFQGQSENLVQTAEFPLYDEVGTWEAAHSIDGGPLFDLGAGYRVTGNFFVGASYTSRTTSTRDVAVNTSVPSPVFTDTFRTAQGTLAGLERSERAVHLQALWQIPVTVDLEVTLFGGPSIFSVRDELIESVTPTEVGGDFSSVTIQNIAKSGQRNTAAGFNLGLDAQYMLVRNAGLGAMLRYSRGSVDLTAPDATGGTEFNLDTGGLEIAAGVRFRF